MLARQQNRAGLDALHDLSKVWADIPQTVELGVVDLFLSYLQELAPTPSSSREWQIEAEFAYMSLADAILAGLPGIIKWSQYIFDMQAEDSPAYIHTLIKLFSVCADDHKWATTLVYIPGSLELTIRLWMWEGVSGSVCSARTLTWLLVNPTSRRNREVFDRVVDAVNGDISSIARLAIRQVKKATKTLDGSVTKQNDLSVFINLISTVCFPLPLHPPHPLRHAFFEAGFVVPVTRSFVTVSPLILPHPTQIQEKMLSSFMCWDLRRQRVDPC
ncbi:hypothetical protein FB45DRAFT_1082186 [Roridomyces roridus]|uniref:Uncharacterized protein n=1 Tax=Roridomyces roridus TaxID=1738132 RepID=A0AAD7BPN8_9AGAR|nr:hypothetical protein FB45DRAFT_1082186 [Roridomyces roridus]